MANLNEVDEDVLILYDDIDFTPPGTPDYAVYLDEGCDIFGIPLKPSQAKPTPSTSKADTPGTSNVNRACECPECARSRSSQRLATKEDTPGTSNVNRACDCPECARSRSSQPLATQKETPGTSSFNKPCECPECTHPRSTQSSATKEGTSIYERPLPVPELHEPATINGAKVYSLQSLRPTTNLTELKMRSANSHQRFITRERQNLYLSRDIIKKIDFEAIRQRKHKEKTINLPARHQVRLRVRADGVIIFHHYHKRGIGKKSMKH